MTDAAIFEIARQCLCLEWLDVSWTRGSVSDASRHQVQQLDSLRRCIYGRQDHGRDLSRRWATPPSATIFRCEQHDQQDNRLRHHISGEGMPAVGCVESGLFENLVGESADGACTAHSWKSSMPPLRVALGTTTSTISCGAAFHSARLRASIFRVGWLRRAPATALPAMPVPLWVWVGAGGVCVI